MSYEILASFVSWLDAREIAFCQEGMHPGSHQRWHEMEIDKINLVEEFLGMLEQQGEAIPGIYSRKIEAATNKTDQLRNTVQFMINSLEAGKDEDALLRAVDLLEDLKNGYFKLTDTPDDLENPAHIEHSGVSVIPSHQPTDFHWTGRDELGFVHDRIPKERSPITLRLDWRRDKSSRPHFVGCYRLDLDTLNQEGFIRDEKNGSYRLRFQRSDDKIEIAIGRKTPALPIGKNPLYQR